MEIYRCDVFQCPWEARSLKPVTSMPMSEVLHGLLLNLESIQELMNWKANGTVIWCKDNEREQSWHEKLTIKQKPFMSESRSTHRVNGKLSQISHSGSLRTTLTHFAYVERVAVPKSREIVKVQVKSLIGPERSQQRSHLCPFHLWIRSLQEAHMEIRVSICGHRRYDICFANWHQVLAIKPSINRPSL